MNASTSEHSLDLENVYSSFNLSDPKVLLNLLQRLRQTVVAEGHEIFAAWRSHIEREAFCQEPFCQSGENLAYYLALRRQELRPLQEALMPWGISSLGQIESRVLPNLDAAIASLGAICRLPVSELPSHPTAEAFYAGDRLLQQHTADVFGAAAGERRVRIMVTLPSEAADSGDFIYDLVKKGIPSRAEVTDAAMAERAECVMLNKGPHLAEGVRVLDDVLRSMEEHQLKKTPRLRPLRSWAAEAEL